MQRLPLKHLFTLVIGLLVFGGLSDHVQAKEMDSDSVMISGGGGIFYPFKGKQGFR